MEQIQPNKQSKAPFRAYSVVVVVKGDSVAQDQRFKVGTWQKGPFHVDK